MLDVICNKVSSTEKVRGENQNKEKSSAVTHTSKSQAVIVLLPRTTMSYVVHAHVSVGYNLCKVQQ